MDIEELILMGAVEVAGINSDTGEFTYNFTDKIKDVLPDLYRAHLQNVNQEVSFLWINGFLEINDISQENPLISLTPKALDKNEVAKLPPDKIQSLTEIMYILGSKNEKNI